jgi:hypothetical protein
MIKVLCEMVSPGMRSVDAIAIIRDYHGRRHFLHTEKDFLVPHDSRSAVPVAFVHRDPQTGAVLIELPQEAETGVKRLWVRAEDILEGSGANGSRRDETPWHGTPTETWSAITGMGHRPRRADRTPGRGQTDEPFAGRRDFGARESVGPSPAGRWVAPVSGPGRVRHAAGGRWRASAQGAEKRMDTSVPRGPGLARAARACSLTLGRLEATEGGLHRCTIAAHSDPLHCMHCSATDCSATLQRCNEGPARLRLPEPNTGGTLRARPMPAASARRCCCLHLPGR